MTAAFQIRRATPQEVIDLRHAILRAGLPREAAIFAGDDANTSRHYAAVFDDRIVTCGTLHLNQWNGHPAWQLRGMATAPELRGQGAGRALLEFLEAEIVADDSLPRQLWANARTPAIEFYKKLGWRIESDEFEIPTAGPHYRISKKLNPRDFNG